MEPNDLWNSLPARARQTIRQRGIGVYTVDGFQIATDEASDAELRYRMQGAAFMGAFFAVSPLTGREGLDRDRLFQGIRAQLKRCGPPRLSPSQPSSWGNCSADLSWDARRLGIVRSSPSSWTRPACRSFPWGWIRQNGLRSSSVSFRIRADRSLPMTCGSPRRRWSTDSDS